MNNKKYILVKGDVSGIQDFIFNVKSQGAARELKGRSFFVKLLINVALTYLFDKNNIKEKEEEEYKISTSGGNFIIKLPNSDEVKHWVEQAQIDFTNSLQNTGLNICFAYTGYDENNYNESIITLNKNVREKKLQLYNHSEELFEAKERDYFTRVNNKWNEVADCIKKYSFFNIQKSSSGENDLFIAKNEISLAGYTIVFHNDSNNNEHKVNDYLESIFPKFSNGNIKLFEHLVLSDYIKFLGCQITERGGEKSIEKLGVLAMDVDNLGSIFEKIKSEQEHRAFDTKLKNFFNNKIKEIINDSQNFYTVKCKINKDIIHKKIPRFNNKVYTVTAGGDDSFFVGKWNTMLSLAIKIHEEFKNEFSNKITISAGLVIVDHKFPVVRFAELVGKALKEAKYNYDKKGNFNIFGEVLQWDKMKEAIKFSKKMSGASGGLLTKARMVSLENIDKPIRLKEFWEFGYYLRDFKNSKEIFKQYIEYIKISSKRENKLVKRNYRLILPVAARLAELCKR